MWIFRSFFRSAASNPIEARFNVITRYHCLVYFVVFISKIPALWHILNLMLLNPPMTYTCGGVGGGPPPGRPPPGGPPPSGTPPSGTPPSGTPPSGTPPSGTPPSGTPPSGTPPSGLRSLSVMLTDAATCPCKKPVWDTSVFTETVQTRFGLICDKKYLISLSETGTYFGMLVGAFLFGLLSDKFGRVMMFSVSFFLTGIAGVAVSQSPNLPAFFAFRFFEGLGAGGSIVTSFVLLIEYTGTKYRETLTALYHIPINLGHLTIAGVSYGLRNAFDFQLAISIPMIIFLFTFLFLNESPLWLLTNKYTDKTVKAMESIAKFNKRKETTIRADIEAYYASLGAGQKKIQLYHIFKHKKLTINLLCMAYLYLVCGMGYYGVSQYISKMSGKIHVNIAISATLVLPGTIASIFLLNKLGRKPLLIATSVGSGVFMIIAVIVPSNFNPAWLKVLFACISNCFFFMSFIVVFLYGVELFPTQIRNSALGLLSLLSRGGMMIAPQINMLNPTIAGCVFGVMALVGGALTFLLPETKNRELPATLEEAETRA